MHRLRRFYYNNKVKIWKSIAIIAFFFIALQILNTIISKNNEEKIKETISNTSNNTTSEKNNNIEITSNESAVTGDIIDETILKEETNIIDEFVSACNNKEMEKAYDMLSNECKETLYQNINIFQQNYYNSVFANGGKKIAKIENWTQNTYKVNYVEDILETGKIAGESFQDYITVIESEGQLKLNISDFIGNTNINKIQNFENIQINVIEKKTFMDYEEYVFQIENKSDKNILLDTGESTKSIYLEDKNNVKYYSQSHEILRGLLKVNSGFSTQVNIKFTKSYSNEIAKTSKIVFSNEVLDYNDYLNGNKNLEKIDIQI